MLEEAADLFARVRSRTEDSSLARTALQTEALVRIFQQNPEEALLLLENETQELMTSESVIAHAKMATGDIEGAKEALQVGIYLRLVLLTDLMVGYLALTGGEEIVWRETLRRLRAVSGTFQLRNLHPAMEIKILLTGAQAAAKSDEAWALDLLEEYTELVSAALFPIQLRGDDYFDRMDGFPKVFWRRIHPGTKRPSARVWRKVCCPIPHLGGLRRIPGITESKDAWSA